MNNKILNNKELSEEVGKAIKEANRLQKEIFNKMSAPRLRRRLLECEMALEEADPKYSSWYWSKNCPVQPAE